jgi:hypothetical protein
VGVRAGDFENLEVVVRGALDGDGIGLLEAIGCFFGGGLRIVDRVFACATPLSAISCIAVGISAAPNFGVVDCAGEAAGLAVRVFVDSVMTLIL